MARRQGAPRRRPWSSWLGTRVLRWSPSASGVSTVAAAPPRSFELLPFASQPSISRPNRETVSCARLRRSPHHASDTTVPPASSLTA